MLKNWGKLLNTDCSVVKVNGFTVYPIFRNGSTSLMSVCSKTLLNEQIGTCDHVEILIRDPEERFSSGLNEYARNNKLSVEDVVEQIKNNDLIDRHFAPQYLWLMHLYRFYKGKVTLRPFKDISRFCDIHRHKSVNNKKVPAIDNFVNVDKQLTTYMYKEVYLEVIIKGCRHALS